MKPLSENADSAAPFISRANLRAIFSELTVIHGVNSVLLQALDKAIANASPVSSARVGGVFVKMGSFLRWYHSYVSNYDNAFQTLKKLKANSAAFRNFIQTSEAKPELGYADLESLLILPIQRVPQYNLLFNDLQKVTTEAHPDFSQTQAACSLLTQIGTYVNEKKRESENIHEVISIGKTLIDFPNLAVPYRRFVRKGTLFCIPDSAPTMPVTLFAFNDVLLLTQETSASTDPNKYDTTKYAPGTFSVLQFAYWDRVTLISPVDPASNSPPAGENPMGLTIKLKDSVFSLVANSPEDRKAWAVLVKDSIETTKRKSAEKEVALALKRKLQSMHHQTQHSHSDSVALRSLGVLAKAMLTEETSDQHSAPLLSPKDGSAASLGAGAASLSTSSLTASTNGTPGIVAPGSMAQLRRPGSSSYMNYQPGTSLSYAELKVKAQEDKIRSKKARELIENEVKQILLKDNIKDGSIDQFLNSFNVDAYYIVPIVLLIPGKTQTTTPALLAISHCAFFIFAKSKLAHSAFLFDIREVISKNHPDFTIKMVDGSSYECRSQYCDDIIYQLRRAYLLTYFGIPESMAWYITTDEWRQPHIIFDDEKKISFGNFVRTYRAACAYLAIPLREDLIWDITHNPTNAIQPSEEDPYSFAELNLSFVEELTNNDLKTLMLALRFNPFFTSLVIRDVVLSRDGFAAVTEMLRYNSTLKRIVLVNNSLAKEHFASLLDAFNSAPGAVSRKLEVLEIRNNEIDNVAFLVKHLDGQKRNIALSTLDLSHSGLGSKAVTALFASLRKSTPVYHTLTKLALAGCRFDTESSAGAAAFLATPCAVKHLDVSGTQIKLTQVLEAMTRGCIYLEHLDISANKWDKRLEPVLIKFLNKTDTLRTLKVNNTGISAEALAHLIEAVSTNVYVTKLRIYADENSFGSLGASLISRAMKDMSGIVELSLADNDFGDEGLSALFQTLLVGAAGLKRLILDANFKLKTTKSRATMMKSLIKFACSKNCKLTHLSIAGTPAPAASALNHYSTFRSVGTSGKTSGAQLRTDIIPLLDCLPRVRISELNISGHRCGPRGVIALGRALQESYHVKKIWWDENGASAESFAALAHAVRANFSLVVCSPPLIDLSTIMTQGDPVANAKILKNIELLSSHIGENEARRKLAPPSVGTPHKLAASAVGNLESLASPTLVPMTNPVPQPAIAKKKSSGQLTVDAKAAKKDGQSKTMRTSTKGGKEGKEHHKSLSHRLKLDSLAHKVKAVAGAATTNQPSTGPKSARGAVEAPRKKSRGPSVSSSSGEVPAATQISPRVSKPKPAASQPIDAHKKETPAAAAASGVAHGASGKLRILRKPSLEPPSQETVIAEAAASVNSESALSTSTAGVSTLEDSSASSSSPIKDDAATAIITANKNDASGSKEAEDDDENFGEDIGMSDDVSVLEDDEVLEIDDNYNDESDEDYHHNPDDEHEYDHEISDSGSSLAPSPAPSPRPDDSMSPTALALRNMSSPYRDPGAGHRYGREAEDLILAATGRSPRVSDLDLSTSTMEPTTVNPLTQSGRVSSGGTPPENRSPRSALTRDSPRGSNPSSPRFSSPSSPRNFMEGDGPEGLRSPVTIRLRPKLSRANSSFKRIVDAAKALPDDLDIGLGGDDDEDSDLDLMERVEVDSDGDHFSDVLLTDDDVDIDTDESEDDDDSAEEKGVSYDRIFAKGKSPRYGLPHDEPKTYQERVTDLSTDTDESTETNSSSLGELRPSSPSQHTQSVETIGERSRENSSAEGSDTDTDDSIDRTQFETMPTPPTIRAPSSKRLSVDRSPRALSPRDLSPRASDAVSLASSVASIGSTFERPPTQPSVPMPSSSSSDPPSSARSDPTGGRDDDSNDISLTSSSSVPSSPVNKKLSKSTGRKKKTKK